MYKKTFLAAFAITALNFLFTWFAAQHWDLSGIEGFFIKSSIVPAHWQIPILSLIFMFGGWCAQYIDPHRKNLLSSKSIVVISIVGLAAMLFVVQIGDILVAANIISQAIGDGIVITAMYALFLAFSNYLGTARKSYLTGLPTPWTMKSDLSWAKTHRLLGRMLTIVMLAAIVVTFAASVQSGLNVFAAGIIASILSATIYSYFVYKKEQQSIV